MVIKCTTNIYIDESYGHLSRTGAGFTKQYNNLYLILTYSYSLKIVFVIQITKRYF